LWYRKFFENGFATSTKKKRESKEIGKSSGVDRSNGHFFVSKSKNKIYFITTWL